MSSFQHEYPFDPSYGYDLDALLRVGSPEPPEDFEAFWRQTYEATRATPTNPSMRKIETRDGYDVFEIEYDGLGGFRVGGWLVIPADGVVTRGVVMGHGYGGRGGPELPRDLKQTAIIEPCGRGFHRSAMSGYPDNSSAHVVYGIESRDTYSHRFCVADLWSAATVLLEQFPQIGSRLGYYGGSFGGGMGAMMLPWDERYSRAVLNVPSFGNHPLRVTLQCTGSGEAVRQLYLKKPEVMQVLRYFDAATHARFIRQPTLAGCALFDPAVPPPGQFAVYNAIPAPKRLFVLQAGHFDFPGVAEQDGAFVREGFAWLME